MKFSFKHQLSIMLIFAILSASNPVQAELHPTIIEKIGTSGSGNGEFLAPYGVEFAEGKYYVAEFDNDRIQVFDSDWNYVEQFGGLGAGLGQLNNPVEVFYNGSLLFVSECGNDRISVFDLQGNFVTSFGSTGFLFNEFSCPLDIEAENGILYIVDHDNDRITRWNESTLEALPIMGGAINTPYALEFSDDNIFVSDISNNQIVVLNRYTMFSVATFGPSTGFGAFSEPAEIFYNNGYLLISDVARDKFVIYKENGEYVKDIYIDLDSPFMFDILGNTLVAPSAIGNEIGVVRITANPFNLEAHPSDLGIQLTWEINPVEGLMEPYGFSIYRDDGTTEEYLGMTDLPSFTDISSLQDANYTYTVYAESVFSTSEPAVSSETGRLNSGSNVITETTTVTEDGESSFPVPVSIIPFFGALMLVPLLRKKIQ